MRLSMDTRSNSATGSPFFTRPPALGRLMSTNEKSPLGPDDPPPDEADGMEPAVEPNPEPIVLLVDAEALELLDDEPVVMRSEKRLELPLAAPRLDAGELPAAAPEVSEEEDVLVAVC